MFPTVFNPREICNCEFHLVASQWRHPPFTPVVAPTSQETRLTPHERHCKSTIVTCTVPQDETTVFVNDVWR